MSNSNAAVPANGIHRAKTWEIGFYALNNTSTNLYMMLIGYISYYAVGLLGLGVVLVGSLVTIMRIWDGVTDPLIGFIVDRTNSKFGKNRPFIVIGNVILCGTTFCMYHFLHLLPENFALRLVCFIVIYAVYIIGYTCQCVVTKSAQSCLTNDPTQRPTFTIFDSIYNAIIMTGLAALFSNYWVPKFTVDGMSGFVNPALYHELWLVIAIASAVCATLAIIGLRRKDRPEFFGLGDGKMVTFRDYWDILRHNRAIQMLVLAASSDKLCLSTQNNGVVLVMLFGIICGNFGLSGQVSIIALVPTLVLTTIAIKLIAARLGQRKALLYGTYAAMFFTALNFPLFLLGDPTTLSFSKISFFTVAFLGIWIFSRVGSGLAGSIVIPMTADCADYETYRTGKYVPGLMGTLFSFVDKVISSLSATIVSLCIASIGFTTAQPTPETPLTSGILWVTLGLMFALPYFGWICNLIAMKYYPLTKEKMIEIQAHIADIKAKAMVAPK